MDEEKIKRWLNAEIQRTKGQSLRDFDESDIEDLLRIYKEEKDVRKAVTRWTFE